MDDPPQPPETMLAMNEALLLGALREEVLTTAGEKANEQLRAETILREQGVAALLLSDRRFTFLAEAMPQKVFTASATGEVVYLNARWQEYTGLNFDQMKDWGWTEFIHPDDVEENVRSWRHSIATGDSIKLQQRFRRADGTYRWHLSSTVPMRDASGAIAMWVGSCTDIEDVRRADDALRASEERFRVLFDSGPVAIFSCNRQAFLQAYNRRAAELWGREVKCGEGGARYCGSLRLYYPDGRHMPHEESPINQVLETGEIVKDAEVLCERPDGTRISVSVTFAPLKNALGEIIGAITAFYDITARRAGEQALRASEARKDAILQSAFDAMITMDHEGKFVEFNPAAERIFGYARAEVLGKPLAELIIPERLREKHRRGIAHYLATGSGPVLHQQVELPAMRADGTEFPAELAIIPIPGSRPPLFTAFLRDITERRRLENSLVDRAAKLAEADRSKDEFLAMLAHELRNPLAPLRNATEILKMPGSTAEERAQTQSIMSRQIENMSHMIDDLLDVSRITKGKIALRRQPVALEAILTSAASLVRPACSTHRQKLAVSLPAEPIFLNADSTRLEQVFNNLLSNACKYSGDGSHISLSAERAAGAEPPEVIVRVSDDGTGIDPELLPKVFGLFVQASRTLDRAHGGLGIGLTLAERLVKLHDGSIEAHSEGLGHGCEFTVRLPILRHAPPPPPLPPPPAAKAAPRRMLIVDDNKDSARTVEILHTRRGHVTRTAFTGPDAVIIAGKFVPEVVLLDIGLPGMDGFEVARCLRAMPKMAGAFIVAMSGYGSEDDRAQAKAAGFDEYMVKPVNLDLLDEWLRSKK